MTEHKNIVEALAAAQRVFPEIPKDKINPHFKSKYASLDSIIRATRPALTENDLAMTQTFRHEGDTAFIVSTLHHVTGTIESAVPIFSEHSMQSLGSAITYARRYGLAGLLGVCADEDDDGNAAGKPEPRKREQTNGAAKPVTPDKLLTGAKKLYGTCETADELLAALDRVAKGQDKFADHEAFAEAINAAESYTTPLTLDEQEHVQRKIAFLTAKVPGVMTAAELDMEAEAAFGILAATEMDHGD